MKKSKNNGKADAKDALTVCGVVGGVTLLSILLSVLFWGLSWISTCGIIKLITLCFKWQFKWTYATEIWLVIMILKSIFGSKES